MHPNEVKLTEKNFDMWMAEAEKMGERHVAALKEQWERQHAK